MGLAAGSAPKTVLVVDDTDDCRYLTARVLEQAGYTVKQARTGAEALALAEDKPDLIVLDLSLPDIDGFEVFRRLKASTPTAAIPVVYKTAMYPGSDQRREALDAGADGYLTAPIEPATLVSTVDALLKRAR